MNNEKTRDIVKLKKKEKKMIQETFNLWAFLSELGMSSAEVIIFTAIFIVLIILLNRTKDLGFIKGQLSILLEDRKNPFTQKQSPIQLTEIGKKTLKKIKGKDIFNAHKNELIKKVSKENPKTSYDMALFHQTSLFKIKSCK